jgi:hypothetical protein
MEQLVNEIRLGYADKVLNERLAGAKNDGGAGFTKHYNQGEEYFLELTGSYSVPQFPIHHDVRQPVPRVDYMNSLRDWIDGFLPVAPGIFSDLTYFFDPGEILKPCFYRLYRIGENYYLYLLRIDLAFRPMESELIERGTNDDTAAYRTNRLYLESDFVPLTSVMSEMGRVIAFVVKQTISQNWIGETGKGYLVRGIWMDSELTKFFSKLFLPAGKRSYPFYPFTCRYKTVCMTALDPSPDGRRTYLPYLHRALSFLEPEMDAIQAALKSTSFSESAPKFQELKKKVPEQLTGLWTNVAVTAYLNANGQKEFLVEC